MTRISSAAALFLSLAVAAPAAAQTQAPTPIQTRAFNLPAQDAATAVPEFARQADVQILAASEALAGMRTNAVSGELPVREALQRLIAGTGLEIANGRTGAFVLRRPLSRSQDSRTQGAGPQAARPQIAMAQGSSEGDAGPRQQSLVPDVIVTAQRRSENQQRVPISLTAFDGDQVDRYRLFQLEDVSRLTPGLLVSTFSLGTPIIAIRGASNTFNQIGVERPVGVFVDDVYISRNSATTFELFGLQSIQVLRGPQGTLFGRNVTGGAIVIDTGRPDYDADSVMLRGSYAEYDNREIAAVANLALDEDVALRVSALTRQREGWGRDRLTGQALDDQDSQTVRLQLGVRMDDGLQLLLGADYSTDDSGGRTLSSIGVGDDGNRRTAEIGFRQGFSRRQGGLSARLFWETGIGELTSITAWRQSVTSDLYSNVGVNFAFLTGTQSQLVSDDNDDVETLSQELRLASTQWERGNFLLGAYFSNEGAERNLGTRAFAAQTGRVVTDQLALQQTSSRSLAVFADGTWNITPMLALSVGGRYTWDRKRAALTRINNLAPAQGFGNGDLERKWEQFTPRAVLNFKPSDSVLAYGSYSRGYTSGGFNTEAATLVALNTPFSPETVDNFEGGVKTEWFDRKLRVNVSGFRLEYQDKQELFFNNVTRVLNITNAARATTTGFEAEVAIAPVEGIALSANYGFLDTRYDEFVIPGGATLTGNELGSAPRHKASATLDFSQPVGRGRLFGNAVYSYTAGYFTGATNVPGLFVEGYSLVNALVGYAFAGERAELQLFARNLLNEDYVLIPSNQIVQSEYLGAPRTIGLSAVLRF